MTQDQIYQLHRKTLSAITQALLTEQSNLEIVMEIKSVVLEMHREAEALYNNSMVEGRFRE